MRKPERPINQFIEVTKGNETLTYTWKCTKSHEFVLKVTKGKATLKKLQFTNANDLYVYLVLATDMRPSELTVEYATHTGEVYTFSNYTSTFATEKLNVYNPEKKRRVQR